MEKNNFKNFNAKNHQELGEFTGQVSLGHKAK